MTGRLLKPGGQGSSGSGSGNGAGDSDIHTLIEGVGNTTGDGEYAFGFPGMEGGDWSEKDYAQIDKIVADVTNLQNRGDLKTDKDIKSYLNGLMEDGGVTLAQYQALKLWYGIE